MQVVVNNIYKQEVKGASQNYESKDFVNVYFLFGQILLNELFSKHGHTILLILHYQVSLILIVKFKEWTMLSL